ncbi:redox-regulated ATPase YchF [Candidatus Woesearchaeota archaeon]|nr:redox-regulated ATPase YchF [Candidatus Woesearchaeota archaeon]
MIVGVVGKANVGKSTFFKAATLADALIANYPFATIKPNEGVGSVRVDCVDKEFGKQCHPRTGYCQRGTRFVPVQIMDVAGLVPGAHEGKGMGNQFLDDLRQADVLIHVVDAAGSTNEKGEPVQPGSYDPAHDVEFLEVELDQWYLGILQKGWEKFARTVVQEKKEIHIELAKQLSGLHVTEEMVRLAIEELKLSKEKPQYWSEGDLLKLAIILLVIAANKMDLPGAKENLIRLQQKYTDRVFVGCSADTELALREAAKVGLIDYLPGEEKFTLLQEGKLNSAQKKALEFIQENVLHKYGSTGVQQVLDKAVFELLGYVAIFPGGVSKLEDSEGRCLPDCFLLPPQSTALDFAYKLHTDLGKHFICAKDVKTKKTIGKDYLLKNRDVIEIVSGK